MAELRRISLPSGGWWAVRTRPTWKDAKAIGEGDGGRLNSFLVAITESWSFEDTVSTETLAHRDECDVDVVLRVIGETVLPWLDMDPPETMAKALFAGMSAGQVPEDFFDVQLMASTGWSWQDLQSAPADVVLKMAVFLAVSQIKAQGGALRFPDNSRPSDDEPTRHGTEEEEFND